MSEVRDQIFLFLLKNAGEKFTVAEIAKGFSVEASIRQFCTYWNLRVLLDQMAEFSWIESMSEKGDTCYYISK